MAKDQTKKPRMKREATLAESIILVLLLFATFGAGAVFGLNYVPLMVFVGAFAAFVGWRCGYTWKEMEEAVATDGHEKNVPDGTAADPDDPDDGMFLAGEEDLSVGELNPYTGHEYESNSVRMNKKRIGYVQVYDRGKHQWMDMTEWAFLGYQERKKALLGKDYIPPIYLD